MKIVRHKKIFLPFHRELAIKEDGCRIVQSEIDGSIWIEEKAKDSIYYAVSMKDILNYILQKIEADEYVNKETT